MRLPPPVSPARALAAFSIGALFFALAFIQRVAPSVFTGELMRDFAVGAAALGALSAWYFYAYAAIQIPVGMLNDRFGPRKLMSAALAVCALGSAGFALSESVAAASLFRAAIGAAVAFAFVGTLTIAHDWFAPARFAMLAGAVQTVGMCGAVLGQAPLRQAVEAVGWRATVGGMAAVAVVMAAAVFCLVPRRPQKTAPPGAPAAPPGGAFSGVATVAANPQTWTCAGIGFGMTATMLAFAGLWAVPWLSDVYAYPVTQAAGVASLLFVGWAVGAPGSGWLSDRIGRRKPVLLAGVLCSAAVFSVTLFAGVSAPAALAVLFFLLGLSGSFMTVGFAAMREVNSLRHSATAMGVFNMFVVGSGAVMQPVVGWLLDLNWDGATVAGAPIYTAAAYTAALSALLATHALALACVLLLRETRCRQLR